MGYSRKGRIEFFSPSAVTSKEIFSVYSDKSSGREGKGVGGGRGGRGEGKGERGEEGGEEIY